MKLVQTSLYSAIITAIKVISGFVASKVIAVFAGPVGVYLIGQFSNLISISGTFATGAINNGVVKYTAEYVNVAEKQIQYIQAAIKITIICSLITGLILCFGAEYFSILVFRSGEFKSLIFTLGITLLLYSLNNLIISILNGFGKIKKYAIVNTISTLLGLFLTVILVYYFHAKGALFALVLGPSIVFFVSLFIVIKEDWIKKFDLFSKIDSSVIKNYGHYALMAIVTALTVPVVQLLIRSFIVVHENEKGAGIWQGMLRISDGYLLVITTALSTYYLPKLSSLTETKLIRTEIRQGYLKIIPVVCFLALMIFLFRDFIIKILYTKEFTEMRFLLPYQLGGDVMKIASWILAYLMLAKRMTGLFILSEVGFSIMYLGTAYYLLSHLGLRGVPIAYFISYFFYFLFFIFRFKKIIF